MDPDKNICCKKTVKNQGRGILPGIFYGLIPHSFCIAFVVFAIIGATTATAFLKQFLLIPNLFAFLVIISLLLATISSVVYLKKTDCLCLPGVKKKWRYLLIMYSVTIIVNISMFSWVMPALANANFSKNSSEKSVPVSQNLLNDLALSVQIPCSGHASLIMDEIRKNYPINSIEFKLPNIFIIKYDPTEVTPREITSLDIFKTYKATIN
jgi:hypothetical protein